MKSIRLLLALVLIPTFAMIVICVCPNANAAVVSPNMPVLDKTGCCCPDGNRCNERPVMIGKDQATLNDYNAGKNIVSQIASSSLFINPLNGVIASEAKQSKFLPKFSFLPLHQLQISTVQLLI